MLSDEEKKAMEHVLLSVLEAYTLYGDILYESDEIPQMLKEVFRKKE